MPEEEIQEELEYVLRKLELNREEFYRIMPVPPKTFMDYPNYYETIRRFRYPIKIACKLRLLPAIVYEKYAL